MTGSDHASGAYGFSKKQIKISGFFAKISQSMMIQWLEFGSIVMPDLLNIPNGLDHDFWPHNSQKIQKNRLPMDPFKTQLPISFLTNSP